tara:strand:- start:1035 stop:1439 length:405 start_codon:yes stop_codon:yes gene_type:complete
MKKIKKYKINSYSKSSGTIITMGFNKNFPIKVKRIFFIHGKKNKIRGDHAHKKCSQFFYSVSGKFQLDIQTPNKKRKIIINHSSKMGILVPPKYWVSVKILDTKSSLMVICDQLYNANDYIENFNEYKKYLRKK